ncbi:MAG: hypothetical protein JWR89_5184, partial [Tardiphaga sp.]|nr:hypothetical protein [Tardiphaga sp.]
MFMIAVILWISAGLFYVASINSAGWA